MNVSRATSSPDQTLERFLKALPSEGFSVSPSQIERFRKYLTLLHHYQGPLHLMAGHEWERVERHLLLSLSPLLPGKPPLETPLCDLGSGGGFPGIPLAIALDDPPVALLDSHRMKSLFLRRVVETLELTHCAVINGRYTTRTDDPPSGSMRTVTMRAVGSLEDTLPLAARLLAPGGRFWTPKGPGQAEETVSSEWEVPERYPLTAFGLSLEGNWLVFRRR